jgi:fructoselysine 6-kinase
MGLRAVSASGTPPRPKLATIGDCCIDEYREIGTRAVGGNAVNVAVNWARAGLAGAYLGAVGPDADGRLVRERLAQAGVDVSRVVTLPGNTGVTGIDLVDGERHFDEDLGVAVDYRPSDADLDAIAGVALAHCATLTDFRAAVRGLTRRGVRVAYDFSTRHELDDLDGVEVAFYSWETEPDAGAYEVLRRAVAGGAATAVVTCGRHGSLGVADGEIQFVAAHEIEPVDSCGAGDSYIAAFLAAHLRGEPLRVCMEAGTAAAAATCLYVGAWPQPGVPTPTNDGLREAVHEQR